MLKQRFVIQFGSQFGIRILGMIAGLIVARLAGPEVVGMLAFGTAYISIWGFITGLFGTGHIKLISEGKSLKDCVATYTWLQGGMILLYIAAVAGIFSFQKLYTAQPFESRTQEIVILLLLVANIGDQFLNFGNVTFTAKLEQFKANYPLILKALLYQAGRILVVFLGMKAIGLAATGLISALLAMPLAWRLLKRLDFGRFDRELAREYVKYALPILLVVVINSIMGYADKLLLAHYTNTTELGYYTAAFSIGGMFLLVSNSVGIVFFPLFSSLIANRNWESVNQKIRNFQSFVVFFIFPAVWLLVIIGGPFLTTLIGDRYQPSVLPFKILLFATYLAIVGIPYGNIISGMGRFYLSAFINFICLVIFLVSIYLLINPAYMGLGAMGIAINLLILNLAKNLLFLGFSFRLGDIELKGTTVLPYLVISAISLLFVYFEPVLSEWNTLWWLIISPFYLFVIYGALYLFGVLTREEIERFIDTLNLQKLRNYISSEMKNKE